MRTQRLHHLLPLLGSGLWVWHHCPLRLGGNVGEPVGTGKLSFFFFAFLGPHLKYREVPRPVGELELQHLAYTTATACGILNQLSKDASWVCDLYHSSRQCWILNPLSKARDGTCILMDTSWVCYRWTTTETPVFFWHYWPFHLLSMAFGR